MYELRKLMVLAVNEAVKQGLLSLEAPPNDGPTDEDGHLIAEIAGRPSVVNWSSISAGEVRVSVWWDYDHSKNPQANEKGDYRESFSSTQPLAKDSHYPKFVGVTVSGWLERKTARHLQGHGKEDLFDVYIRRGSKELLQQIPEPKPEGYKPEGKFFL
ncbi:MULTISPECIES: hypothetical protein [Rhizobium]|uniref:Uncharacterized protein n=1 Tax=Rhizobium leguminosarum TaxID=384 RepID=A0A2Z4YRE5_RHILE|nr:MULTISPECIES: hypothetical protein [Rhizobium]AXA43706.1 hypothetical protein DLJ82_7461 [Rhizobium leguminosarum]MBA9036468.1 hypothetical protein [Rhizobium leguminosarum]